MFRNARNRAAEYEANHEHAPDPQERARNVVREVRLETHLRSARDHRRERPYDGHEARQNDRLPAVLLVELLGPQQMLLVKEKTVLAREQPRARHSADVVAARVTQDCRDGENRTKQPDVETEVRLRCEQPGSDQERVAWEKETEQQTGFNEYDDGQSDVPGPLHQGG